MTTCGCGHGIEYHGDRAVFPACEGEDPRFFEPMLKKLENSDFTWVITPRMWPHPPCECKGFKSA